MSNDLGPVISEHKGRLAAGGIGWYLGGVFLAGCTFGLLKALVAGSLGEVLYMLIAGGGAALWLLWLYSKWKQSITIHQLGFVLRRVFREPRAVRFDQVTRVDVHRTSSRQSIHLKGVHVELCLSLQDGSRMVLTNDIADIEQLASYAQPGGPSAGGPSQGGAIGSHEPSPWG